MESRREPNTGALRLPQVPSFRPPLRAGARPVRWGRDPRKRDTVLAAVKDASRRLRRWPKGAIRDCGCARCHWANAGRDEETALGRTKKLIKTRPANAYSLQPHQSRRAATLSLQSSMHRTCPQTLDIVIQTCRVSSRSKMSTISPVEHPQARTRGEAPSPGSRKTRDPTSPRKRGEVKQSRSLPCPNGT